MNPKSATGTFQPRLQGFYDLALTRDDGFHIDFGLTAGNTEIRAAADSIQHLGRRFEGLRGDAPPVQACSSERVTLNQSHVCPAPGSFKGGRVSTWPCSYDRDSHLPTP